MRSSTRALVLASLVTIAAPPALLGAEGAPAIPTDPPTVPCRDPRGCPDLVVDATTMTPFVEVRSFSAYSCAVQEGATQAGTRRLLRFTFTTPNLGPGDLVVGSPVVHDQWYEFGECHLHWHFREYADYRLWTPGGYQQWIALRTANPDLTPAEVLAAHPDVAAQLVQGHKQGFCVIDLRSYGGLGPKYLLCDAQGISVGWADQYHWSLDGQWLDVTDVAPGPYVLESEVNAERLFDEADYMNNRAAVEVTIA